MKDELTPKKGRRCILDKEGIEQKLIYCTSIILQ
jgi:hypothetical protein